MDDYAGPVKKQSQIDTGYDCVIHNDTDLIDAEAAQSVVDSEVTSVARQVLDDADTVRLARVKAGLCADAGSAHTLAAAAREMAKQRKTSQIAPRGPVAGGKGKGKQVVPYREDAPLVGPVAQALDVVGAGPEPEAIDLRPYLPTRKDRPEWYEPDPLIGGHCVADVLTLCADRETASQAALCEALGITSRQWSAWLLCAPRETADLVRRLQRIGLADAGVERLRDLLDDSDPYVQLGAVKMAVVDLDPERHAGSLHKDAGLEQLGSGGPREIHIHLGPEMRNV